ncbi:hypothetical protein ACJZ2D_005821 [Fusarium nematophilum]
MRVGEGDADEAILGEFNLFLGPPGLVPARKGCASICELTSCGGASCPSPTGACLLFFLAIIQGCKGSMGARNEGQSFAPRLRSEPFRLAVGASCGAQKDGGRRRAMILGTWGIEGGFRRRVNCMRGKENEKRWKGAWGENAGRRYDP